MQKNKIKILILDDEPIVCDRLKPSLEKNGYLVESFVKSEDALDRLSQQRFDILITDLKMSGPKGIEVIRFAKQQTPNIIPIVISGFATKDMAKEAFEAGATEFIPKPFKMSQIKGIIDRFVNES
jgi:DNA-binding NtrC family response regulator